MVRTRETLRQAQGVRIMGISRDVNYVKEFPAIGKIKKAAPSFRAQKNRLYWFVTNTACFKFTEFYGGERGIRTLDSV